jgi:hypothetical protein
MLTVNNREFAFASKASEAGGYARTKADGVKVRDYASGVQVCPFDGEIKPNSDAAKTLRDLGCYEISLGGTAAATAERPRAIFALRLAAYESTRMITP